MTYDYNEQVKNLMEILPQLSEEEIRQGIVKIQDEEDIEQAQAVLAYKSKMQFQTNIGVTAYVGRVLYKGTVRTPKERDIQDIWVYTMQEDGYAFNLISLWEDDIYDEEKGALLVDGKTFSLTAKPQFDKYIGGNKLMRVGEVVNTENDDTVPDIWGLGINPLGEIYDSIGSYALFEGMVTDFVYSSGADKNRANIIGLEIASDNAPLPIRCMFSYKKSKMPEDQVKWLKDSLNKYQTVRVFGRVSGDADTKDAVIFSESVYLKQDE